MSCLNQRAYLLAALSLGASACTARPLLPTLSLHALLVLHQAALGGDRPERSRDLGLQAQLSFRPRHKPHPRVRQTSVALPMVMPLTAASDCQHALLCEWAQLAEESTLAALGVTP
jgi:hypothetical protein